MLKKKTKRHLRRGSDTGLRYVRKEYYLSRREKAIEMARNHAYIKAKTDGVPTRYWSHPTLGRGAADSKIFLSS